jgi:hypothetical protein
MALILTVDDIQLASLNISSSGAGPNLTLSFDADWLALDDQGAPIGFIEQKKSAESKLFSEYPQSVRDAVIALNAYATNRIKVAHGIE